MDESIVANPEAAFSVDKGVGTVCKSMVSVFPVFFVVIGNGFNLFYRGRRIILVDYIVHHYMEALGEVSGTTERTQGFVGLQRLQPSGH